MDLTTAEKHIKRAWVAGVISGSLTLLLIILSMSLDNFLPQLGYDWWTILDVLLIMGLAYGIYRKSRVCSILLVIYFLFSKILLFSQTGGMGSLAVSAFFLYLFIQGTRGTFANHALQSEVTKTETRSQSKKWLWIGGGIVVAFAALILMFLFYLAAVGPDTKVVPGAQLKSGYLEQIKSLKLLDDDEQIRLFYSDGFLDIEEGLYFFTDRKVVIYSEYYEEPSVIIPYSQIDTIEVIYDESFWEDSQITITLEDGSVVWFPVSSEDGGDQQFFKALHTAWKGYAPPGH